MTLGELITALEAADPNQIVKNGFGNPHSYRGDYMDLAFEPAQNVTVASMLEATRTALGTTYQGWKGGDFTMDADTWCWLSEQGTASCDNISSLLLKLMLSQPADEAQPWLSDSARIGRALIWTWTDIGKGAYGKGYRDAQEQARTLLNGPQESGEEQQPRKSTADKAADLGLTDTEYRARSHAAAVAKVWSAIPGMYAHVGFRLEDVLNDASQTQQAEDPARIDRMRPEFTEHASVESIDVQLRRARSQLRRWHLRVEWLISLRAARVEQKARGEWPAAVSQPETEV